MKKLFMLFCAGALISVLCAGFTACNENGELSDEQRRIEMAKLTDNVYYVAGNDAQSVVVQEDDGTAKCGVYLFISENLQDTVSVYNYTEDGLPGKLLDGVFEFPAEIVSQNICGFVLFPKEYRYSYPVKINSHRPMTAEEEMGSMHVCNTMIPGSSIIPNKSIVVESLTKIERQ